MKFEPELAISQRHPKRRQFLRACAALAAGMFYAPHRLSFAVPGQLTAFSALRPGPLSQNSPWGAQQIGGLTPNRADIVATQTSPVLRIRSEKSASAWAHEVPSSLSSARFIDWSWLIDGAPSSSLLGQKEGDDFAARLYVVFDYPLDRLSWRASLAIRLARIFYSESVPAAALCYVWHPSAEPDQVIDSPYTDRVKMIVARSNSAQKSWTRERRDIQRDFSRAFGAEFGEGMAAISAIIVSADTDQSGGRVDAYFGDISLSK